MTTSLEYSADTCHRFNQVILDFTWFSFSPNQLGEREAPWIRGIWTSKQLESVYVAVQQSSVNPDSLVGND